MSSNQVEPYRDNRSLDIGAEYAPALGRAARQAATYLWTELAIKVFFSLLIAYYTIRIIYTINKEVNEDIDRKLNQEILNIKKCKEDYELSSCDDTSQIRTKEYLEKCIQFKECMNSQPIGSSRSKAFTEKIAILLNTAIENMSPIVLLIILIIIAFYIWFH